jgi:cysteinyl-tRNA synthetase
LANTFNKTKDILVAQQLKGLANILGLLQRDSEVFMQAGATEDLDTSVIEAKIAARAEAKKTKNFAEADRIRQELLSQGVVLEDTAQGTIWRSN